MVGCYLFVRRLDVTHVSEPTHTAGHTLDLVITSSETEISGVQTGDMISDHALVRFTLQCEEAASVQGMGHT